MSLNQIFQAIRDGIAGFFAGIWNYPINWGGLLGFVIAFLCIGIGVCVVIMFATEIFRGVGAIFRRLFSRPPRPQ